ncbi:MAG: hypothetical protein OXH16_13060 [Gemmatimonadetes bacterium]|nr:hypothetical protein [Gemmatimonadota bacterium]
MWVESRQRLIALESRDIKLECREIVFDNGRNIEVVRYPSPQAAAVRYNAIVQRLTESGLII